MKFFAPAAPKETETWQEWAKRLLKSLNALQLQSFDLFGQVFIPKQLDVSANTSTDGSFFINVDTSSSAITITIRSLEIAQATAFVIKDVSGNAGTNNITINTEGSETIDGSASKTISTNYGTLRLYGNNNNLYEW